MSRTTLDYSIHLNRGTTDLGSHVQFLVEAIPAASSSKLHLHDGSLGTSMRPGLKMPESSPNRITKDRVDFLNRFIAMSSRQDKKDSFDWKAAGEEAISQEIERRAYDPSVSRRAVHNQWSRDPKGKYITPDNSLPGKMTSNGIQLWGATPFDFYGVRRIPFFEGLRTISSASKLSAWMKANGEQDFAPNLMGLAEEEDQPREMFPCDIGDLILAMETRRFFYPIPPPKDEKGKGKGLPFNTSEPFGPAGSHPNLQTRLPLRLLPKKLIVHDPFNLAIADPEISEISVPWSSRPDIERVYRLHLSREGQAKVKEEEKEISLEAKKNEKKLKECWEKRHSDAIPKHGMFIPPILAPASGKCKPWVYALHEPPPTPNAVEEAHLYITPAQKLGEGNHSYVFKAEWELPRSLLMPAIICPECVTEKAELIIKEEDGPNGETTNPMWNKLSGELIENFKYTPPTSVFVPKGTDVCDLQDVEYVLKEAEAHRLTSYVGPIRIIDTKIEYQDAESPSCGHAVRNRHGPSTVKVTVAAKLSKGIDDHLEDEAVNYQRFPQHLFEHWNGYNVIPPLHDPVPVGAVVPQFYGYYVPAEGQPSEGSDDEQFRSPILLVEHCGKQISVQHLNRDDRTECASLIFRFHYASWLHGSIFSRNILFQYGPLHEWPLKRKLRAQRGKREHNYSFRLIDFGRSQPLKGDAGGLRSLEERQAEELLNYFGIP